VTAIQLYFTRQDAIILLKLDGKYSERVQIPSKAFLSPTLATLTILRPAIVSDFPTELFCKQSPVYGVFWPLLSNPSTDRNETRTWSSLSP